MHINRKHDARRGLPPALLVSLGVILIAGMSFGGALLWQRADDAASVREEEARPAMVVVSPVQSGEADLPNLGGNLPFQQVVSTLSEQMDEPPLSEPASGLFAVDWQVPASAPVEASYFYDAVFLGDTLATGLTAHRLVNRNSVFATIGALPQEGVALLEDSAGLGEKGKVYLMFGMDSRSLETEDFFSGYQSLIAAVRGQHPAAAIYIVSIPPVTAYVGADHPGITGARVAELNAAIARLAGENRLHFLNVFEGLAGPDGSLPAHASRDGLHLSAEYHFILFDYIKSHTVGG